MTCGTVALERAGEGARAQATAPSISRATSRITVNVPSPDSEVGIDWQPDRTVFVSSAEGGQHELHLWTVTAEIKRALQ